MAGRLRIASDGMGGGLTDGHSWIEHVAADGTVRTWGTWGNNPLGTGNGLFENLEVGREATAFREVPITDEQEAVLMAAVTRQQALGDAGWSLLNPCSSFAASVWEAVTGEVVAHRSWGVVSNPNRLAAGINALNEATPLAPVPDPRPAAPSIRLGGAVMECSSPRGPP